MSQLENGHPPFRVVLRRVRTARGCRAGLPACRCWWLTSRQFMFGETFGNDVDVWLCRRNTGLASLPCVSGHATSELKGNLWLHLRCAAASTANHPFG